jgi:hypothetical protein
MFVKKGGRERGREGRREGGEGRTVQRAREREEVVTFLLL